MDFSRPTRDCVGRNTRPALFACRSNLRISRLDAQVPPPISVRLPLDELWALSPFLIVELIGVGLALAATAVLVYVPFSQRSLLLMGEGDSKVK